MKEQEIIKRLEKLNNVYDNRDKLYSMFAKEFNLKVSYYKGMGTGKLLVDENGESSIDMKATKNKETGKYMIKTAMFNIQHFDENYTKYKLTKKGYKVEQPFKK